MSDDAEFPEPAPYLGLKGNSRCLRVQTNSQQGDIRVESPFFQSSWVLRKRQSVKVNNGEVELIVPLPLILQLDPWPKCAEVVSKMRYSSGLDSREYNASWSLPQSFRADRVRSFSAAKQRGLLATYPNRCLAVQCSTSIRPLLHIPQR
jgi:hypothetical protein